MAAALGPGRVPRAPAHPAALAQLQRRVGNRATATIMARWNRGTTDDTGSWPSASGAPEPAAARPRGAATARPRPAPPVDRLGTPRAVPPGALTGAGQDSAFMIVSNSQAVGLDWLRNRSRTRGMEIGVTTPPVGSQAPDYDPGITWDPATNMWYCRPVLLRQHDRGRNESGYLRAGDHETTDMRTNRSGYLVMSDAMAVLARQGEMEHVNDIRYAGDISIVAAEDVLVNHVCGQVFPAAATQTAAEQYVIDTIGRRLTQSLGSRARAKKLGTDPMMWNDRYRGLCELSRKRDIRHWHDFDLVKTAKGSMAQVTRVVTTNDTAINQHPSNQVILYRDLP
ncbi:hypothetical protein ACN27G_15500 [Plantactinospora sp. WMMB334]|uniref:hypothetical protein n=1 Tax=Plantactinospora sp. WMMB334 TaxID=3404119 RepID=UPI003B93BCE8